MAFVLTPVPPIADWLAEFDTFARRSPGFFAGRPVVVDISQMPPTRPDLVAMVTELRRRNIVIMGLDGRAPGELGADARGLPPILSGGKEIAALADLAGTPDGAAMTGDGGAPDGSAEGSAASAVAEAALAAVEKAVDGPDADTLIVDHALRSGQSIVHLTGDVVVVGSVASGSEVVSSGSIHVYGALNGRAIAGSAGNRSARIFASRLNAELVAINGLYKTAEDLERACVGRAVQAWLDGDALKVAAF
ncbi:septum site-determining protein MinC [Acuticoccus sp.]|uniref:septum site-determining protein MinC n=1 Tax=Acuticoccus sp. TaxID=1904378 RepID=UPI003B52DE09